MRTERGEILWHEGECVSCDILTIVRIYTEQKKELFYTQCGSYCGENIAIIYGILKYYLLTTFNSMIF